MPKGRWGKAWIKVAWCLVERTLGSSLKIRVYLGEKFLKGSGGIMRVSEVVSGQIFVRFCILLQDMRGRTFHEDVQPDGPSAWTLRMSSRTVGAEVEKQVASAGAEEEWWRLVWKWKGGNRCGVKCRGGHECQSPRVGAPCAGDINQKEGVGLWPAESRVC